MGYRPTKRELELEKPGHCTTCGRYCPDGRNTAGQCMECHNRAVREWRERRKAALAAMPRCAVPGCRRRATWWHPDQNGTGLCGHHKRRAEANIYGRTAGFGLFGVIILSREELIKAATSAH